MISQVLLLFDIGGGELFLIVLVIIMFFGSNKIPELARTLGKGMQEIKNATNEIKQEIRESTKDITGVTDSLSVEKQVKNFINKSTNTDENPSTTSTAPQVTPAMVDSDSEVDKKVVAKVEDDSAKNMNSPENSVSHNS